jgi:hypothetical protein
MTDKQTSSIIQQVMLAINDDHIQHCIRGAQPSEQPVASGAVSLLVALCETGLGFLETNYYIL